ncbi:hypothetical protein KIPB_004157 [Kipferlia bialata]|uniref:Uncharacterized protein n=1 Tax=Kipferlia bialata TaxID=797122 RepID=A0A9K3CV92_9EUKA|nr:hypothetical protein KIPB_004157 [Kipferlia bialata]|eukprot:g4157.t1
MYPSIYLTQATVQTQCGVPDAATSVIQTSATVAGDAVSVSFSPYSPETVLIIPDHRDPYSFSIGLPNDTAPAPCSFVMGWECPDLTGLTTAGEQPIVIYDGVSGAEFKTGSVTIVAGPVYPSLSSMSHQAVANKGDTLTVSMSPVDQYSNTIEASSDVVLSVGGVAHPAAWVAAASVYQAAASLSTKGDVSLSAAIDGVAFATGSVTVEGGSIWGLVLVAAVAVIPVAVVAATYLSPTVGDAVVGVAPFMDAVRPRRLRRSSVESKADDLEANPTDTASVEAEQGQEEVSMEAPAREVSLPGSVE